MPSEDTAEPQLAAVWEVLDEAHMFWHQLQHYTHDPVPYKALFHSIVQSLRNVTFRLQSQKSKFGGRFDEFYRPWQDFFRRYEPMRQLVEARNAITKQGGLVIDSRVQISVVGDYLGRPEILRSAPSDLDTASVFDMFAKTNGEGLRSRFAEGCVVSVRRLWSIEGYGHPINFFVAHAIYQLASLLDAAEHFLRGTVRTPEDPKRGAEFYGCGLIPDVELETQRFIIGDDDEPSTYPQFETHDLNSLSGASDWQEVAVGSVQSMPRKEFAAHIAQVAPLVFRRFGYLETIYFLHDDRGWVSSRPQCETQLQKIAYAYQLGEHVHRKRTDAIVVVSEYWVRESFDDAQASQPGFRGSELMVVGERIGVTAAFDNVDVCWDWSAEILRLSENRASIGAMSRRRIARRHFQYLAPVFRVWENPEKTPF